MALELSFAAFWHTITIPHAVWARVTYSVLYHTYHTAKINVVDDDDDNDDVAPLQTVSPALDPCPEPNRDHPPPLAPRAPVDDVT